MQRIPPDGEDGPGGLELVLISAAIVTAVWLFALLLI